MPVLSGVVHQHTGINTDSGSPLHISEVGQGMQQHTLFDTISYNRACACSVRQVLSSDGAHICMTIYSHYI